MDANNVEYYSGPESGEVRPEDITQLSRGLLASFLGDFRTLDFDGMPDQEVDAIVDRFNGQMLGFLSDPDTVIAKDGDKIVGLVGLEKHGKTRDGKDILDISRFNVNPDYRRGHIGYHLIARLLANVTERYPNCVLLSMTRNDDIKRLADTAGFSRISLEEYYRLGGRKSDKAQMRKFRDDGYIAIKIEYPLT